MLMNWVRRSRSVKWELLLTFLISGGLIMSVFWIGIVYGGAWYHGMNWWLFGISTVIIVSLIMGYVAGVRLQRRLDVLHLSMMQVIKGNWSERIPLGDEASFDQLYEDFNTMVDAMEKKLRLLQKMSEQQVMDREKECEAVVLEERRRLARDLHDTVSQQLFALHMASSSLPKVMERDMKRAEMVVNQLIQMSHIAQRQMRSLIAQLRPLELDGRTLQEALDHWFPDYCRQNGLQGKFDIDMNIKLSEAIEHQSFLMIQEAMANVVKHARATQVTLTMHATPAQLILAIADDGQGFDLQGAAYKTGSYGLTTMKERVDKLGGNLDVISQPGAGTTIRVHIPLFREEEEEAEETASPSAGLKRGSAPEQVERDGDGGMS